MDPTTLDPLRALDTLDRYGWRVRWVTDLGEPALLLRSSRLLLVSVDVTREEAEGLLLRLTTGPGAQAPRLRATPALCWAECALRVDRLSA